MPYHPKAYDLLINSKKYKIIQEVEIWINDFAKNNNIKLYGSYNPNKYNFKETDFLDTHHVRKVSLNKLKLIDFKF